jgi:DNA-binding response OmpR family regulator
MSDRTSGPTVVLADDEPNIRETLAFILEMEGYAVTQARDGEEALERVREVRPMVLLLDAMMPRRNGFDVCRTIKADPALAGTVVIMVTALGQRTDRERALAAGADHYVAKPFDENHLLDLVRSATTEASSRRLSC